MVGCVICNDNNYIIVRDGNTSAARECACVPAKRLGQQLKKAGLPQRYCSITLDDYVLSETSPQSLRIAAQQARRYVDEYVPGQTNPGLLFVGSVGVGKTHLAVSVLRELVTTKGVSGSFYDFRELLTKVKATYQPGSSMGELSVLEPVMRSEIVVLDELGAMKQTEWVTDCIEQILNARYNDNKATIITTNYANRPREEGRGEMSRAMQAETLRDRVGTRMHSRLQEMCRVVEMQGPDYRSRTKQGG